MSGGQSTLANAASANVGLVLLHSTVFNTGYTICTMEDAQSGAQSDDGATSGNASCSKLCIAVNMKNVITQCGKCVTRCLIVVPSSFIHFIKSNIAVLWCFVQIWVF